MKPRGTPARAVLAGGLSRHGAHCPCPYCAPYWAKARAALGHAASCACADCAALASA